MSELVKIIRCTVAAAQGDLVLLGSGGRSVLKPKMEWRWGMGQELDPVLGRLGKVKGQG